MKRNALALALGLCAVISLPSAVSAQAKKVQPSGAETGLLGIKLFDSGIRVVAMFGSPTEIQAVNLGGGGPAGPGGGAAGGPGGKGLPSAPGGGGGMAPGTPQRPDAVTLPGVGGFGFGDELLRQRAQGGMMPGLNEPGGTGGGTGGGGAMPGKGGAAGGPGSLGGGNGDRVTYTRWIYDRNGAKYSFIIDKFNRVVQCEAIGITPGKVKTRRGITFGSTFAQIIKKYGAPDGYEMSGDSIVVRYLSKAKCAFRLNKLGENKPDVVTGIVVAAGKR